MSLYYANQDTARQITLNLLPELLSSDKAVIDNAEKQIEKLQFTEGYGVYLAEFVMNQSFELPLRQMSCVLLTRYIEKYWDSDRAEQSIISESAKRMIRNILPNGLYDPNSKIRSSVAHAISAIALVDWPTRWTELFDIIIKCLGGNEDSIHGAMQILHDFNYDEKQIKEVGPVVISEMYRIFESEQNFSVATRTSAIDILKPLFRSIAVYVTNKQDQENILTSIMNTYWDKLMYYLDMDCVGSNYLMRMEIVKFLTFVTSEMPKCLHVFIERTLSVIWQMLTQIADVYVKDEVNRTEQSLTEDAVAEDSTNMNPMIIQVFELVQCVICTKRFRPHIKNVLTDLLYIVIVYIQVPAEQIEEWNDDPDKFVDDEEEGGGELTIRLTGQDMMMLLNEEVGDAKVLPALHEAISRHLNVAESYRAAGNPNWWKIPEACMVAVHEFHDLIIEQQDQFDLLNYLIIVRNLLNYTEAPHLVGRALYTLSTYSNSKLFNPQMLEEIMSATLQSLSDEKSVLLKISAIRAINAYLDAHTTDKSEKRVLIKAKLPGYFQGIMQVVPGCKTSTLSTILEALLAMIKFDEEFSISVQDKLISLIIAVFLKYPEVPFIIDYVQNMIEVLSHYGQCQQMLQERFVPTLVSIIAMRGELATSAKQDIALEMLTTLARASEAPLSSLLMDTAFPAMIECVLSTDDYAVMVAGGECLREYICTSSEQVCSFHNGKGLEYVMQLTTMLLNPMNSEQTAGQIGRLVITIITKMGNMLGENVDLLLKAVISKMQLVVSLKSQMNLVVIFAYLFLTQMDAVLNFLYTVPGPTGEPAIKYVFSNWLPRQSNFFGMYERKVTTMALCKLFEYGVTTQDERLTSVTTKELYLPPANMCRPRTRSQTLSQEEWIEIPALVKIFKLLVQELAHLKERVLDIDDSESEDDDTADDETKDKKNTSGSEKNRWLSDMYFVDEEENAQENDQLMKQLQNDPLFQASLEDTLTNFLRQFAANKNQFSQFVSHLTANEVLTLESIEIKMN